MRQLIGFVLSCFFVANLQAKEPFWPGVVYDPAIPTLNQVVGHEVGEKLTSSAETLKYLDALVAAAPDRTRLVSYANSWNGRPLKYLVISSAENMQRLDTNRERTQKLADPRLYSESEQARLVDQILPVSWMSYGVHGDEISSTDAALLSAYHLLAASGDETVDKIMTQSIVVIDPVQNPDGRARFMAHLEQAVGLEPAVHYLAAEHRQAWPGGRTNHYLFDMNRDWFALTQPETRGKVREILKYFPVVHADVHEMGVNQSYYFPPPTAPFNPHISEQQKNNLELYGRGNASAFDDFDFDYFTREIFDAHYAGYGDTWPAFHGAIAMTFEASSARGMVQRKSNGELVTYRSGVHRHFVASIGTMLTTANHGNRLLTALASYRRSALQAEQHYLFSGDESLQRKLMTKLLQQGVEVHQLADNTRVCGKPHGAGSFVVKAGQPAGHLVRTLLDADSPIGDKFWQEVERKRDLGLDVDTYDVLAWSMPALYGLDVEVCQKAVNGLIEIDRVAVEETFWPDAKFGYLVENTTSASMALLADLLRHDIEVRNADAEFVIGNKTYDRGTLLIKASSLSESSKANLFVLANKHEVPLVALNQSWTDSGINFGSDQVYKLRAPKIALAWDLPTFSNSAGNTRFVIERLLGYPVTPVRTGYLGRRDMDYFDVIVIPDGGDYVEALGETKLARLQSWVARGGVLITIAEATRLLIDESFGLLASQLEANVKSETSGPMTGRAAASVIESEDEYVAVIGDSVVAPDSVSGVMVRGETHPDHWLGAGVSETLYMVYEGQDIYTPLKLDDGTNVVRFAPESELVYGGYLWKENQTQLAYKPAVMASQHGDGVAIGFTFNPTYRGFMDGFHVMLGNALFKAPSR